MKLSVLLCGAVLCASAIPRAPAAPADQAGSAPGNAGKSAADAAWQALVAAQTPTQINSSPNPSDERQVAASVAEQARLKALAAAAHDFYTNFPGQPHAADARKLEPLALLQAVQLGDAAGASNATTVASAFRSNKAMPVGDRIDVALAQAAVARNSAGAIAAGSEADYDALRQEFGDIPEVSVLYIGLARSSDAATSARLAAKIKAMNIPPASRAEVDRLINRPVLVGTHVSVSALGVALKQKDIEKASGATVLYFWNGNQPALSLGAFDAVKGNLPAGVNIVFVELGSTTVPTNSTLSSGINVSEARQLDAPIAQAFGITQLPSVVVLRANGIVSGYGQVSELPALLPAALK